MAGAASLAATMAEMKLWSSKKEEEQYDNLAGEARRSRSACCWSCPCAAAASVPLRAATFQSVI